MKPAQNHQKPCAHKAGNTTTKQSQQQQKTHKLLAAQKPSTRSNNKKIAALFKLKMKSVNKRNK